MSERKVVDRNVAFAFGVVCIILTAGLVSVFAYYATIVNEKNTTIADQEASISDKVQSYNVYVSNHHYTDEEYNNIRAAKLVAIELKSSDNRLLFQTPYLKFSGYVCNVGIDPASNAKLGIIGYQGNILAVNTTISLGTINGGRYTAVDSQISYSGDALTSWYAISQPSGISIIWGQP